MKSLFPNPENSDPNGVVSIGGNLKTSSLYDAYYHGIFPWPHEGLPLLWFSPAERGVIDFSELKAPKSYLKWKKKQCFRISINKSFKDVLINCAQVPRKGQTGTWITNEIIDSYVKLNKEGWANSLEIWNGRELVGGIYGVCIGHSFSAESMFGLKDNVSKLALESLCLLLLKKGLSWIDIQMVTPVTEAFGGKLISRKSFLLRLEKVRLNDQLSFTDQDVDLIPA